MATYYALPALTTWSSTGSTANGFSLTSGGTPVASANPVSPDIVIFDLNSGPGRAIATNTNTSCGGLTITANASGFSFGTVASGGSATLTLNALSTIDTLRPQAGNVTVVCNGGYVSNLSMTGAFSVSLGGAGNFGAMSLSSSTFNTNSYDFTATSVTTTTGSGYVWNLGTSNITINGVAAFASTDIFNGYSAANVSGSPNITFNVTSVASNYGVTIGTVSVTTNLTINSPGPGSVNISNSITLNNLMLRGNLTSSGSITLSAAAVTIDGNGCYGGVARVTSPPGVFLTVIRRDTNVTYLDRVRATNINFSSQNSKAIYSRSDQGSSGTTGITLIPGNSRFLSFF